MFNHFKDYSLFLKFLETYTPVGFQGIERNDPLMIEIEELMEENNQFFYIADIIQMKVLFTSMRSTQMIGSHSLPSYGMHTPGGTTTT
jgi:hypothetical protein